MSDAVALRPVLLVLITTVSIGSPHTAEAQTAGEQTVGEQTVEARKSPWEAVGLSLVWPGAGQAYNGQWAKGALMLGGGVASAVVVIATSDDCPSDCGVFNAGVIGLVGFALWSLIDASRTAKAINRRIDAGQVAVEIGPRSMAPNRNARVGLSLVRVRF